MPDTQMIVATKQQVSCDLGEEAAILNLKNSVYYGLSPVGASIWRLLDEPISVGRVREAILSEYEVAQDRCEADLQRLLAGLLKEGLIEMAGDPAE